MKNIIYKGIVIDAGNELCPSVMIHPFKSDYLCTMEGDIQKGKSYLDSRFGSYKIFTKARVALYTALKSYNLSNDDIVTILTTSDNFYISKCVTQEINKICQWNREVTENTKVIIVNHEFGFPRRRMQEVADLGLPIIEDCAHSFYDTDTEIGKYSDFVVYSLPKAFPMQMGGVLKINKQIESITDTDVENYVLKNLSKHVDLIPKYIKKRRDNFKYLAEHLEHIGIVPYFRDEKAIPGTFLFKWHTDVDYTKLKEFMYLNGVECSVFYGKSAFFIPVHQEVKQIELDYMIKLLEYYYKYGYEV